MEIGNKVFITERARTLLGLPDGIVFTIKDILVQEVTFPMVLSAEEFGEDWVEFFEEDELILIEE
jgi:hypothetical protein